MTTPSMRIDEEERAKIRKWGTATREAQNKPRKETITVLPPVPVNLIAVASIAAASQMILVAVTRLYYLHLHGLIYFWVFSVIFGWLICLHVMTNVFRAYKEVSGGKYILPRMYALFFNFFAINVWIGFLPFIHIPKIMRDKAGKVDLLQDNFKVSLWPKVVGYLLIVVSYIVFMNVRKYMGLKEIHFFMLYVSLSVWVPVFVWRNDVQRWRDRQMLSKIADES